MTKNLFQETLTPFVYRARYSAGQLAHLTGIPKRTVANWLSGRVRRPRQWQEVVRLAAALHLSAAETDELLTSAGHEKLSTLRRHAASEAERGVLAPWPAQAQAPFQAIADLPYFVGRSSLLQEMATALRRGGQVTMTSLRGMGGVGKTALAARLAYRLRDHFSDGVLWARLDTSDTMSILATFAAAYDQDVAQHRDVDSRAAAVRGILAGRRVLIVLDNAEESAQVRPLLPPSTENIGVIVTTRSDLAVSDQMLRFVVEPFPTLSDEPLSLFTHFLGARTVRRWRNELQEIAALLGGLPLALAIAAGRLAAGADINKHLTQLRNANAKLDALVREDRSVRLSFDVTFAALAPSLQAFFTSLGAFGGSSFAVAAAAYVAGITEEKAATALDQLAALSLVQPAAAQRFALHPLLRVYAREKQTAPAADTRMATYYIRHSVAHEDNMQALKQELDNIVFALDVAQQQSLPNLFVQGVLALSPAWRTMGSQLKAIPYLEQALEQASSRHEKARILLELGSSHWAVGQFRKAKSLFGRGEQLAANLADDVLLGRLSVNLGVIAAYNEGDYASAVGHLAQGLSYARSAGDEALLGLALSNLANAHFEQGDWERAGRYWEEGLQLMKDQGREDSPEYARLLHNMGVLAVDRGEFTRAATLLEKTLLCAQHIGFAELESTTKTALGRLAYEQERFVEAQALLEDALLRGREVNLPEATTIALCHLGTLHVRRGDATAAEACLDEAGALAQAADIVWLLVDIAVRRGEMLLHQGNYEAAHTQFATAVAEAQSANLLELEALARFGLARAVKEMGETDSAIYEAQTALSILAGMGHFEADNVQRWLRQE